MHWRRWYVRLTARRAPTRSRSRRCFSWPALASRRPRASCAGCGIPPNQQQAIFRPYVGGARSDDLTSQGLGLSIARYCVTAMGGDIWVESDGHRGATLSFTLPLASPTLPVASPEGS